MILFLLVLVMQIVSCGDPSDYAFVVNYPPNSTCHPDSWFVAQMLGPVGICYTLESTPGHWFTSYCGQESHFGLYVHFTFTDSHCLHENSTKTVPYYPDCTDFGAQGELRGSCRFSFPGNGIQFDTHPTDACGPEDPVLATSILRDGACVMTGPQEEGGVFGDVPDVKSVRAHCQEDGSVMTMMYADGRCDEKQRVQKRILKKGVCDPVTIGGYKLFVGFSRGCEFD